MIETCCEHCFDTREIIAYIYKHGDHGTCPWCGSHNAKTIKIQEIGKFLRRYMDQEYRDLYSELYQLYKKRILEDSSYRRQTDETYMMAYKIVKEHIGMQSISEIMIDDKEIFSERLCPEDKHRLLKQIFSYPDDEQKKVDLYTDIDIPRFVPRNAKI